jgi:hypothetical protein
MFQKRKKKLINPRLQLRLVGIFFCAACLAVQVEAILITLTMTRLSRTLGNDGSALLEQVPEFVRTNLLLTFAILTPVMLAVGIVATFKIAGPLHNFEQFLRAVRDGQQVEPCRIRKGDELQTLCTLINEVTAPLRERAASNSASKAAHQVDEPRPAIPAERDEAAAKSTENAASDRGRGRER